MDNPFGTLECVMEHVQSAFLAVGTQRGMTPHEHRAEKPKFASPEYHLKAAEEAVGRLFQRLAVLLPGARAEYDGEPTDTILGQIGE